MKNLLLLVLVICPTVIYSQTYTHEITWNGKSYTVRASSNENDGMNASVTDILNNKEEFAIYPLHLYAFQNKLADRIEALTKKDTSTTSNGKTITATQMINDGAFMTDSKKIFYSIVAEILSEADEEGPKAGTLMVSDSTEIYFQFTNENKINRIKLGCLKVRDLELEINEGYLETVKITYKSNDLQKILQNRYNSLITTRNYYLQYASKDSPVVQKANRYQFTKKNKNNVIKTTGIVTPPSFKKEDGSIYYDELGFELTPETALENANVIAAALPDLKKEIIILSRKKSPTVIKFTNKFGIGFSTIRNFENLDNINLYRNSFSMIYICLGDVIDFNPTLKPNRKDYCPANQVINATGGQVIETKKEDSKKIFEAIIYGDFLGIQGDKPNGLIQTEVDRRFNTNTVRWQTKNCMRWLIQAGGIFQYISTSATVSKIENKNRYLPVTSFDSLIVSPNDTVIGRRRMVTPIQLMNYQNFSVGADVNVFMIENASLKYQLYGNIGFRYGLTLLRDSLRVLDAQNNITRSGFIEDITANYFTFYPELVLKILPDERFGFRITERPQYLYSAFSGVSINSLNKGSYNYGYNKWINTFEILAYVSTGPKGKLFARWRFNNEIGNITQNYHQIQLGYTTYIVGKFSKK